MPFFHELGVVPARDGCSAVVVWDRTGPQILHRHEIPSKYPSLDISGARFFVWANVSLNRNGLGRVTVSERIWRYSTGPAHLFEGSPLRFSVTKLHLTSIKGSNFKQKPPSSVHSIWQLQSRDARDRPCFAAICSVDANRFSQRKRNLCTYKLHSDSYLGKAQYSTHFNKSSQ